MDAKQKSVLSSAQDLVDLVREVVREELDSRDNTVLGQVVQKKPDGTYDLYVEPDHENIVHNVVPLFRDVVLNAGDFVYVYKFHNQLSNSVILTKLNGFSIDPRSLLGLGPDRNIVTTSSSSKTSSSSGNGVMLTSSSSGSGGVSSNGSAFIVPLSDINLKKEINTGIDDGVITIGGTTVSPVTQSDMEDYIISPAVQSVIDDRIDNKVSINNETITIGNTSITPITSHQPLNEYLKSADASATYQPKITSDNKLSYDLLTDKPALFSGNYSDLSGKPTLFSGDYTDLANKPTIPSVSLSDGTISINGSTIKPITSHQSLADYLKVSAASETYQTKIDSDHKLNYSFLAGTPTIPTKVSDLTNDSGFLTSHQSLDHLQPKIDADNKLSYDFISDKPALSISNGTITIGENSITPLTEHQSLAGYQTKITSTNKISFSLLKDRPDVLTDDGLDELEALKETISVLVNAAQVSNSDTSTTLNTALTNSAFVGAKKYTYTTINNKLVLKKIQEV